MEYSSKTKQILLTIIVLVIAVSIAYAMLFLNIKEKNNNISALSNEIDIVLQKEIKLRSVKHLINDTEQDRVKLDSHFVTDDEVVNFIEKIENLGTDSGTKVEVISVYVDDVNKEVTNQAAINELLYLDFKTEGSFAQMFHFLSMLEKLPFKIDIPQVNFEKTLDGTGKVNKSLGSWKGLFSITVVKLK